MRVLVVLAHKTGSKGKALGQRFVKQIRTAFAACYKERLDVLVRSHTQLAEFIPMPASETDVPDIVQVRDRLAALDGIDFVFFDGDDNLLPWSPPAAPLLQLLHLCMSSGKMVFGCGCAVALLAYLASVGPVQVPIFNGGGRGGTLQTFGSATSSGSRSATPGASSVGGASEGLLLERQTGDLFRFDERRRAWTPVGNVGVHCSLGAPTLRADGADGGTGINRSDGIGPCELTQLARFHALFDGVWPAKLVVPEANEWHCHLPTLGTSLRVPTGAYELQVLATSRLGGQVLECRNAVALQFRPDERFPHTLTILSNFVASKIDRMIGEGCAPDEQAPGAELPRRLLEMAARDPQHSDLVQQLVRSLAPPTSGPFAVHASPPPAAPSAAAAAPSGAGTAGAPISALAPVRGGGGGRPSGGGFAESGFSGGGGGGGGPPSVAAISRPGSAASAPQLGHPLKRHGGAVSMPHARPGSAQSEKTISPRKAAGAAAVVGGNSSAATGGVGSYRVRPSAALSYVTASRDALKTHAEQVHVGRTTKAYAGMAGMGVDVPIYGTRPPRASSAGSASRTAHGAPGPAAARPTLTQELVPRVQANDLVLESVDPDDPARREPPPPEIAAATAAAAAAAARPRVVRIRHHSGKPFSNYQKYEAVKTALKAQTIHVTSVGPYISKLEQRNLDEQDARHKSIHKNVFKPGGLWDKYEPPPGGWGFAAAGFMLPDDLPATAKRYGSFYNTHAHQFRVTAPKQNLYM